MFANNIYTEVFKVGNFNIDQFSYIAKTQPEENNIPIPYIIFERVN